MQAIRVRDLGILAIREAGLLREDTSETGAMVMIDILCSMHGFVSLVNSRIVDYLAQPKVNKVDDDVIDQYMSVLLGGVEEGPDHFLK